MGAAGFRYLFGAALVATSCTSIAADQRTFDGTSWRVAAIRGEATPMTNAYVISFGAGAVGGRLGCNQFGARYAITDMRLQVQQMRSTDRICGEPGDSFEGTALAILSQPLSMDWASAQRLQLKNDMGSLSLERLP